MDRLEIIKGKVERSLYDYGQAILDWSDIKWLIGQAEKANKTDDSQNQNAEETSK